MKLNLIDTLKLCLSPAGEGVYTVNTAKERKDYLQRQLYKEPDKSQQAWLSSLTSLTDNNEVNILGIASDCGGGILRGANWGPLFLRTALLSQYPTLKTFDLGDVRVIPHLLHDKYLNNETIINCRKALYNNCQINLPVSPLSITEHVLNRFYHSYPDKKVFAIGGDHSVSYPLVKSHLINQHRKNKRCAVIHFDAHTDLLTDRLGIDICFGSWCYPILKALFCPSHLIQLGIRSSAYDKKYWQTKLGITQYWTEEIQTMGPIGTAQAVIKQLRDSAIDTLYITFDIDALDVTECPATGTPEENGLSTTDVIAIIKLLGDEFSISGADMVEIAPLTNSTGLDNAQDITLTSAAKISATLITLMGEK